jgi:hypothetical protein
MAKQKKTFKRRWHKAAPGIATDKVYLSADKIRQLITKQLEGKFDKSIMIYLADSEYYCAPLDDIKEVISNSRLDKNTWVAERFDCDDFAHVLKAHFCESAYSDGKRRTAHAFGVVWGNLPDPHAINWVVTSDMKLRFVEPQSDEIFIPRPTDKDIYFMLS